RLGSSPVGGLTSIDYGGHSPAGFYLLREYPARSMRKKPVTLRRKRIRLGSSPVGGLTSIDYGGHSPAGFYLLREYPAR
ncbi:hypothetical protein VS873_23935, partial [Salmonella enterica subsp. enterica serovar Typhi]|nr:hypothetical protein [Salmonella enterica subsp. enterica serovar Typhi]